MRLLNRATMVGLLIGVFVVACSGSGDGGGGGTGTGGGGGGGKGDGGGEGGMATDAGTKEGGDGAANVENGGACMFDGDCKSDHCRTQGSGGGGGGGAVGSFCTIFCAMPQQDPAPECVGAIYTGKCGGSSFCQIK